MPELPEVETVCRGLNQYTLDKPLIGGQVLHVPSLAYPSSPEKFDQALRGQKISHWTRRGKYLLAQLTEGGLGVHLRMTGQLLWTVSEQPLQKHTRIIFQFLDRQELRFVDTRSFGKIWAIPPESQPSEIITGLQKLGVEPLSEDFTLDYLYQTLKSRQRPIKALLLDQGIIAGIGNIYADESLFKSGIHPETQGNKINLEQLKKLQLAIIDVLSKSIEEGGTTFSDFVNLQGINGNYGGIAFVYGRKDQPCRNCQTPIVRIKIAGRSTHFCPQCQSA